MKKLIIACLCSAALFSSCKKDKEPVVTTPVATPVTITSINPAAGPKNTVVTITGSGFGTNSSAITVYFNGVEGTVQTVDSTSITAVVPQGASTGAIAVKKNNVQTTGPVFTFYGQGLVSTISLTNGLSLLQPSGITRDAGGNLFVCDRDHHRIIKITPAGISTVFAGTGVAGFVNGAANVAQFNQPYAITMDGAGNFYIGDRINHAIRKMTAAGVVSTLAGNGTAGDINGTGSAARFNEPVGVAADAAGNVFVADYINDRIKKVTPAGVVTTVTNVNQVFGLTLDPAGNIYYTEYSHNKVTKYSTTGATTIIAGDSDGSSGSNDGVGTAARFYLPAGIARDNAGNLYVCDAYNNRIRKISSTGVVTTIAGNSNGYLDGMGITASFSVPLALCGDFSNGALYVADFNNNQLRKVVID